MFFSESIGLAEDLFYLLFFNYLFPADPQNRLREDHNAFFQAFDFHELVCSVHTVVDFKVCASKRNAVFQMMHIRSAADRKWFAWFSSDIRVALQQGLDKRAVGRDVVWWEHSAAFHGEAAFFHVLPGGIVQAFFCRADRGAAVVGTGQGFTVVVHKVEA